MPIVGLRVPAEDATRVGRVVGQLPAAGEFTVYAHRDRAAEWRGTGHRIAVRVAAGIVETTAAHIVRVVRRCGVAVLAVQAFG